jgi:PEP-CTERM motif
MTTTRASVISLATAVAIAALSSAAQAALVPVVYTLDPTQSTIKSDNVILGVPSTAQLPATMTLPASDIDGVGGTITGDLDTITGALTITAGSLLDPVLHPQAAAFQPPAGMVVNSGNGVEGNLAIFAATHDAIGVDILASIRDLLLTIPQGTIQDGMAPMNMQLQITAGRLSSNVAASSGLAGDPSDNMTLLPASLTNDGVTETLVIPYTSSGATSTGSTTVSGVLVATRPIPEPSTVVLASLGVAGMVLVALRKRYAA